MYNVFFGFKMKGKYSQYSVTVCFLTTADLGTVRGQGGL